MERNPSFLSRKYGNLSPSPEVEVVAKRVAEKTGEPVATDRETRIQQYLDYLKDSLGLPDESRDVEQPHRFDAREQKKTEKLARFKNVLYKKYIIKPENIPESYWKNQQRIAREQGHGDIDVDQTTREQLTEVIIADQKSSLDNWVDYLTSPDAVYPDWLKYYAFRSILATGEYDKQKKSFPERNKGTTKGFPDINREALAIVLDALQKKYKGEGKIEMTGVNEEDIQQFERLLQGENFAKLYAWAIEKVTPASVDQITVTAGQWIIYKKGFDHIPLVRSLQGHGTGWCTAGESTAKTYLEAGDLYVYYSVDPAGQPIIPRAAVCMHGNTISEVRGIAKEQNLDPYIGEVVQKKLAEFPDGKAYEKKSQDMKTLTVIEQKTKANKPLTREELLFLYEVDAPIEGFGYKKDPRIKEILTNRDSMFDACVIFKCLSQQIAKNQQEITKNTKVYIGPLFKDIFITLSHIEHIYTSFPEGRIHKETFAIGGKTKEQLLKEMDQVHMQVYSYARQMMGNKEFIISKNIEQTNFVRLTVKDMFGSKTPTTDELYAKAKELGLELCPPETGPAYRLHYADQPFNEWVYIGMKQISSAADGRSSIFNVGHADEGLWLSGPWTNPGNQWNPEITFLFRLRKLDT